MSDRPDPRCTPACTCGETPDRGRRAAAVWAVVNTMAAAGAEPISREIGKARLARAISAGNPKAVVVPTQKLEVRPDVP